MYKICFITLITNMFPSILQSPSGLLYKSTKNTMICHMERRETLSVKHWVFQPTHLSYYCPTTTTTLMVMTKVIDTFGN
jgi:hypothetical protein